MDKGTVETLNTGGIPPRLDDSLRKRYIYKLVNNIAGIPIALAIQAIIPRGLGPEAFGNYSFLSSFFTQVTVFFDSGTSIALFSKLSQRQKEKTLKNFYWKLVALLSLMSILFVFIIFETGFESTLWPNQETKYILMATVGGLFLWYSQITNKIIDAHGLTASGEVVRLIQKLSALIILSLMFWYNIINLSNYFFYIYFTTLSLIAAWWWWVLHRNGIPLISRQKLDIASVSKYSKEFYNYSSPLISYALIGMLAGVSERWLLQHFSGSIQQGFYGLSYQIGALCFLFTSAMTPLLTREFSISFAQKDLEKMKHMFSRYIPLLYSISAFFAVFFSFQSATLTVLFGGKDFRHAATTISIMALYPIHQTYGQLSGSIFYATGQTKLYRNIGSSIMLIGVPMTFFLIAPHRLFGLNLGATGLAIQMIVIQFVGVNIQLWYNAKYLNLSFLQLLWHQVYSVMLLSLAAFFSSELISNLIMNPLISFLAAGTLYVLGCIGILLTIPSVFSLTRKEVWREIMKFRSKYFQN